jgi:hypothetical protein
MYFSIEKNGCGVFRGLCQIRYDLFLEEGDYKYEDLRTTCTAFEGNTYPGEIDNNGFPTNQEDFNAWASTLPQEVISAPFNVHFCQIEPTANMSEILYVGEMALAMAYENWLAGDVGRNWNYPVEFSEDPAKIALCEAKIEEIQNTDFSTHPDVGTIYHYKAFNHYRYIYGG